MYASELTFFRCHAPKLTSFFYLFAKSEFPLKLKDRKKVYVVLRSEFDGDCGNKTRFSSTFAVLALAGKHNYITPGRYCIW